MPETLCCYSYLFGKFIVLKTWKKRGINIQTLNLLLRTAYETFFFLGVCINFKMLLISSSVTHFYF